jgi:hypothetical protein
MNSIDLTAKLLATENLTVVRTASKTASFDTSTRVLSLPLWKDMTPEIESMFISHEVGHALYTTGTEWYKTFSTLETKKEQRLMKGYINVVEDARIEKLMKRRFPGIRKTFFSGYNQLMERDFFKVKGRDVNEMLLIDRINLYFKGGISLGIKFTPEEKLYVNKVDRAETIEEVIQIAKELVEFTKKQQEARQAETQEDDIEFSEEEEYESDEFESFDDMDEVDYEQDEEDLDGEDFKQEDSEDSEDSEESEGGTEGGDEEETDELESETDRNLNQSLEELADDSIEYTYFEVVTKELFDPVIPFKRILSETTKVEEYIQRDNEDCNINHKAEIDKFMIESERMVNYLVKEFEMRKSAQAYRRASISKSGSLNTNKLHAYKITDDIFKRIMSIPDGKNHGMLFLLDWSGSMSDAIVPTIKQVINLAMFCRRINIPFEVYAFSGSYHNKHWTKDQAEQAHWFSRSMREIEDKNVLFSDGFYSLLNIFSSKMSNLEFNTMARRFTHRYIRVMPGYDMGDTPLNEALVHMMNFVPEFKRKNNIEKLTLITLTDGAGGHLRMNNHIEDYKYVDVPDTSIRKKVKVKNFIADKVTGKNYEVNQNSCTQTTALLRMIKERFDVTLLGFYICPNRRNYLQNVHHDHFGTRPQYNQVELMKSKFKEQGFYSLLDTGRDELFVIPDTSTKIIDAELDVDSSISAAQIARKFSKQLNTKKHSRILLDKFIGYVA